MLLIVPRYPKPPRRIDRHDFTNRPIKRRSSPTSIAQRASQHEREQLAANAAMDTFRKDAVKLRKLAVHLDVAWLFDVSVELDNLANELHSRYSTGNSGSNL